MHTNYSKHRILMVNQSPDLDQWPLGIGVARHTSTERPSSDKEKQAVGASPLYVLTTTERPDRADLIPQGISRTSTRRTRENKSDVGPGRARKPSAPRRNSQSPTKSRENRRNRTRLAGMVLPPRRKAVVVGCCYTNSGYHQDISLYGPANDAHAFALNLVNLLEFHPNDVCLLTDVHPSSVYRSAPWENAIVHRVVLPMSGTRYPRVLLTSAEGAVKLDPRLPLHVPV